MNTLVPIARGPMPATESNGIANPSSDLQIEPSRKRKREKSYTKCNQCRTDKQKCVEGPDPSTNMCKRCHDRNLQCSGPVEMAKGRPRKVKDDCDLDLSYLTCYLKLLASPLRAISDYEKRMRHLFNCDLDIEKSPPIKDFRVWIKNVHGTAYKLARNTSSQKRTLDMLNQSWTSPGPLEFTMHQPSLLSGSHYFCEFLDEQERKTLFDRYTQTGHIEALYEAQLVLSARSCSLENASKLVGVWQQYNKNLEGLLDTLRQQYNFPWPVLGESPLPFPDVLTPALAEKLAENLTVQTNAQEDCLGRSLPHYLLDTVDQRDWDESWQSVFTKILDSTPGWRGIRDIFGRTILYTACEYGHYKAVVELLTRNADWERIDLWERTGLGLTPLHIAAVRSHTSICTLLLQHSKNDVKSEDGVQWWIHLCFAACHGHCDVVQLLLEKYGKIDANHCEFDHHPIYYEVPVTLAILGRHLGVLKLLGSASNFSMDFLAYGDCSALHHAVHAGFLDSVEYLLGFPQLSLNSYDNQGRTPLIVAAEAGAIEMVKMLVKDTRTWLCVPDYRGRTVFHLDIGREVQTVLEAALETRWRPDHDITIGKVLAWPCVRAYVDSGHSFEIAESILKDLKNKITLEMMRVFEMKRVTGWINASDQHWAWAEVEFGSRLLDFLDRDG